MDPPWPALPRTPSRPQGWTAESVGVGAASALEEGRRQEPRLKKILLIILYCLGVLLLFEGAARLALSRDDVFAKLAGQDDSTWRLRWTQRHRGQVEIFYTFDAYHPTRGWAIQPNVSHLPVFIGKLLNTNSRGLRGATEYPNHKPPDTRRIVVLGDSFTFGEEVSDDETYAAYLAQRLPGTEVLNLGVHGYGHDQMLLYLREEGIGYAPDVVLVGFVYDDMYRNLLAFRDFAKPRFVLRGDTLMLTNSPVPSPAAMLGRELFRPKLLDIAVMLREGRRWRNGESQRQADQVTRALLDEIARTTQAAGATPVFVHLPTRAELGIPIPALMPRERFLASFCRERNLHWLSVRPALGTAAAHGQPMVLSWHWSPEGHQVAAGVIADYLTHSGLLGAPH